MKKQFYRIDKVEVLGTENKVQNIYTEFKMEVKRK